ncbi:hypothetical protein Kirov_192 [Bacillus phage Kirov]|uniref:Uncharacterized protein n=1 Tax=Bacillus phage Kirov TaxID=2783539 RepID=A0A7U3NJY8_9CAUD|nr:hypothetical protein PQE67_gp112 [Bacillus phage Kirov]QOV08391.1 hypothetical protein Kirov_192 [Bacillus phage Kirov]
MKLTLKEKDSILFHLKSYRYFPSKQMWEKLVEYLNR